MYKFYDTDKGGWNEYDISGREYIDFLDMCFRYCTKVSFRIWNTEQAIPDLLEKYRIPTTQSEINLYKQYYRSSEYPQKAYDEVRCYRLSPEVCELLLGITDSIFKWICGRGYTNPEDIAFYREDGSVFFRSCIHEGECSLIPRENEDVGHIVLQSKWVKIDLNTVSYELEQLLLFTEKHLSSLVEKVLSESHSTISASEISNIIQYCGEIENQLGHGMAVSDIYTWFISHGFSEEEYDKFMNKTGDGSLS